MINPDEIRAKHDTFTLRFRGHNKAEVAAFLGRVALVVDVLGDEGGSAEMPELPTGFTPDAIRSRRFQVVWRGLDVDEVRAYLHQLADDLDRFLSAPPQPAALRLPDDFAASSLDAGMVRGSEIKVRGRSEHVDFATPEGLTVDIAARLEAGGACLVPRTIVVADLAETTLRRAVTQLEQAGEL